jgi:protein TonB
MATVQKKIYQQPRQRIQNIPFEINPRLPALPNMPQVAPPMSTTPVPDSTPPQGLNGLFEIGEIDGPLTALTRTPPLYPYRAKRMGIEGWVKVRFIVNENGRTEDIRIIEARPEDTFDKSVLQCVSSWRFKPGTVEGIPVKTMVSTTIRFKLE